MPMTIFVTLSAFGDAEMRGWRLISDSFHSLLDLKSRPHWKQDLMQRTN
jgi:hypothetical protein